MANDNCLACALESTLAEEGSIESAHHTCERGTSTTSGGGSASAYTFDNYQDDAGTTAIYPDHGRGTHLAYSYLFLKLNGEAGEAGEAYAKFIRGDYDKDTAEHLIFAELGDVLWYASQLATELGVSLGSIANDNIRKLADRKSRGVLRGSGDNR